MDVTAGAPEPVHVDTVIIGAGQAGLSTGYHLARLGRAFVILEGNERVGDAWRKRWDSLRLFTPARFDGLDGMPFPAPKNSFPTKDEMGDYLEAYAKHFRLPVRTGSRVDRVWREDARYMVSAGDQLYEADNVVIAMASYQRARVPSFAWELSPEITQVHSLDYKNLGQLKPGAVLIVGAGNSGAELAVEAARAGRTTYVSGRVTGDIPFRIEGVAARLGLATFVFRFVFHRILTVDTPMGRRMRRKMLSTGTPLIRTREGDLARAGVTRVPRVEGVRNGKPLLANGRTLDVSNVVWCTGFDLGLSFIDLPIFDAEGEPRYERGIVTEQPGLFFVGQHFQYAMSSMMIHGVGRDAERIAKAIALRPARARMQGVLATA
ncbi:MAG TPA: NAD(P)-binding domain-containing protein [Gemmatimonadaceae bacterium]|jgi:putative flavoprotein involved in K+ transport|nr:NAD(P)-binding domain-containing protein [Gemmatimonadaceae bacterium]